MNSRLVRALVTPENGIISESHHRRCKRLVQPLVGFSEVIEYTIKQREKYWDKFFQKYSRKMSDDVEIDLEAQSEAMSLESKTKGHETINENEDVFTKNRTPLRKHSTLIQYWIDTGNSPYQINNQNEHSTTGSSLSEDEITKCQSSIRKSGSNADDIHNSLSMCSSVDTAAYILSNTNVTKKCDIQTIVDGSKDPVLSSISANFGSSSKTIRSLHDNMSSKKTGTLSDHSSSVSTHIIASVTINEDMVNKTSINKCLSFSNEQQNKIGNEMNTENTLNNIHSSKSMKITDVLPVLEQFDKIMRVESAIDDNETTSSVDKMSITLSSKLTTHKSFNRKKLYTGRNSPIDIIHATLTKDCKLTGALHPALMDQTPQRGELISAKRRFTRIRQKQKLQSLEPKVSEDVQTQSEKNEESVKISSNQGDFFSSLGLTPILEASHPCSTRKIALDSDNQKLNNEDINNKKLNDLKTLCKKKNLVVSLERIALNNSNSKINTLEASENFSADTIATSMHSNCENNLFDSQDSSKKTGIQPVDFDSMESDASTILLYECAREKLATPETIPIVSESTTKTGNALALDDYVKVTIPVSVIMKHPPQVVVMENDKTNSDNYHSTKSDDNIRKNSKFTQNEIITTNHKVKNQPAIPKERIAGHQIKKSMIFRCQSSSSESDENLSASRNYKSKKFKKNRRLSMRSRITFSLNNEEDFVQCINRHSTINRNLIREKHTILGTSPPIGNKDEEISIRDLTSNVSMPLNTSARIVDTEDEESNTIISASRHTRVKNVKLPFQSTNKNDEHKRIHKLPRIRRNTKSFDMPKIVTRLRSRLDSSDTSEENILLPRKKFKESSNPISSTSSGNIRNDILMNESPDVLNTIQKHDHNKSVSPKFITSARKKSPLHKDAHPHIQLKELHVSLQKINVSCRRQSSRLRKSRSTTNVMDKKNNTIDTINCGKNIIINKTTSLKLSNKKALEKIKKTSEKSPSNKRKEVPAVTISDTPEPIAFDQSVSNNDLGNSKRTTTLKYKENISRCRSLSNRINGSRKTVNNVSKTSTRSLPSNTTIRRFRTELNANSDDDH